MDKLLAQIMGVPQAPLFDTNYHMGLVIESMNHMDRFVSIDNSNINIDNYITAMINLNWRNYEEK